VRDQLEADCPLRAPRLAAAPLALQSMRVIDLTHFVAGPSRSISWPSS
jgi:hypothetical protein